MSKDEKRRSCFAVYDKASGNDQQKEPEGWRKPAEITAADAVKEEIEYLTGVEALCPGCFTRLGRSNVEMELREIIQRAIDAAKATVNETLTVPHGVEAIAENALAQYKQQYNMPDWAEGKTTLLAIIAEACREAGRVAVEQAGYDTPYLEGQIERLASFIMSEIEGEPSWSQGAGDTAIRVMADLKAKLAEATGIIECLESQTKLLDDGQLGYLHGEALVVNKLINVERERDELRHWKYLTECHAPYDAACATLHIEIEELTTKLADVEMEKGNLLRECNLKGDGWEYYRGALDCALSWMYGYGEQTAKNEKLRGVLEDIGKWRPTCADPFWEIVHYAQAALKPREEPKKEEQDESK